ncbi:unnamed protein product [Closterium sp. Yama58-4]|nr:unnamed protein product [Closterium sp. Yama58-4]
MTKRCLQRHWPSDDQGWSEVTGYDRHSLHAPPFCCYVCSFPPSRRLPRSPSETSATCPTGRGYARLNASPRYTTIAGHPKSCPFARSSYACERNNRPDLQYREYRWQPFDCPISYFSVSGFRFLMRDRRMLLVGDSMMSNLFEALLCSISSAGYDGQPFRRKTKGDFSIKGVRFPAFSFSLEYYFSPYIVRTSRRNTATGKDANKGGHGFDVYVDEMDPVLEHVLANYSAVVFHSGVWWLQNVPRRTVPNSFFVGGQRRNLSNIAAHTWALSTVLSYVKQIDYSGVPFFLSFSPKHAGAGQTQPGVEQSDGASWVGACGARVPASSSFVHSRGKESRPFLGTAHIGACQAYQICG